MRAYVVYNRMKFKVNVRLCYILNTLWLRAVNYDHLVVPQDFDIQYVKVMIIIIVKHSETIDIVGNAVKRNGPSLEEPYA